MSSGQFVVYVIYKNPTDYPGKFVLRRWVTLVPDKEPIAVDDDYNNIRKHIPAECTKVPLYFPDEDPCIYEKWWY